MTKWLTLCAAAMLALMFVACDDNEKEDLDIDTVGDTDVVTDETTDTQTDNIATDEDTLVTDDEFVIGECTKIDINDIVLASTVYEGVPSINIGSETIVDKFSLQFYIDASTVQTELTVGSIDLASDANDNYSTCTECALMFEDYDAEGGTIAKYYFQYDGTLDITEVKAGTLESKGTITARLVEVTIESGTYLSTPVAGGACYEITGSWDTICVPDCTDKVCGSNGCGGECGDGCEEGKQCNEDQTACIDCTVVHISDIASNIDYPSVYEGTVVEEIGAAFDDLFWIEFYGTQTAGTFDLAGTNYVDCQWCIMIAQDNVDDAAATPKSFFQQAGSIVIDELNAVGGEMGAESKGRLEGVRLVEVTVASDYTSTPVPGGACITIAEAEWDTMGGTPTDDDSLLPDN